MNTEKLFSYGTPQYESVQIATFGRKLYGTQDILKKFALSTIRIHDDAVVSTSGEAVHPIISYTGQAHDQVTGMVFDISPQELVKADSYEVSAYKRVKVQLISGVEAWTYVSALSSK